MNKIDFQFYIKESDNFNKILAKWFNLLKWIKPKTFRFSCPHKGNKCSFKNEMVASFLTEDLTKYEKYLLEINGDEFQYINISLAPYLKEIAIISCRFTKENYENYKEDILEVIDEVISTDEMMLGYGHPVIYNKYVESGYGHIKLGAYWMMWFGKWALKYIDNERINNIKENTMYIDINDKYVKAILTESPWEYDGEIVDKKQRKFMKKLKFSNIIDIYNKEREFTEIEFEEEKDPLLEEDNSPCPYED